MGTYRKKPVQVQAIQFTGANLEEIWEAFGAEGIYGPTENNPDYLILTTTHGDPAPARAGDWVVPDSKPGTFYPIKPDVFEATYEPVATEVADADRSLPYGGTVAGLRLMIADHARTDEGVFGRVWDKVVATPKEDLPEAIGEAAKAAHHAALYGWSIVAILLWLGQTFGPDAAYSAAAIVQDLGENGGNDLLDDIPAAETVEVQR